MSLLFKLIFGFALFLAITYANEATEPSSVDSTEAPKENGVPTCANQPQAEMGS